MLKRKKNPTTGFEIKHHIFLYYLLLDLLWWPQHIFLILCCFRVEWYLKQRFYLIFQNVEIDGSEISKQSLLCYIPEPFSGWNEMTSTLSFIHVPQLQINLGKAQKICVNCLLLRKGNIDHVNLHNWSSRKHLISFYLKTPYCCKIR